MLNFGGVWGETNYSHSVGPVIGATFSFKQWNFHQASSASLLLGTREQQRKGVIQTNIKKLITTKFGGTEEKSESLGLNILER